MRKTREVLRLKFDAGLSNRQIARATGISCSTVSETVGVNDGPKLTPSVTIES